MNKNKKGLFLQAFFIIKNIEEYLLMMLIP